MQEQELRDLYTRLMDQNLWAFTGQSFEIAYHLLAAAMHCAAEMHDAQRLGQVQRTAEEHGRWIDTHLPEHKLSSRSARTRNHDSVFVSLAIQTRSMLLSLKVDAQVQELKRQASDGGPELAE